LQTHCEIEEALADTAIADKLTAAGLVVNGGSPEAMTNTVKQDVPHFAALVKSIGIKPE
jgi:tripartite-type tricarboxylate transporter receptor subunit TctC